MLLQKIICTKRKFPAIQYLQYYTHVHTCVHVHLNWYYRYMYMYIFFTQV